MDAGCGSGRDANHFAEQGFQVEAIDASPMMIAAASQYSGVSTSVMRMEEITAVGKYDGIWACASLVHMSYDNIGPVLQILINALKREGVLLVSLKHGHGQVVEGGRQFQLFDEDIIEKIIGQLTDVKVREIWTSVNQSRVADRRWLNFVIQNDCVNCT